VHADKMVFRGDMVLCTVSLGMLLLWITRYWNPSILSTLLVIVAWGQVTL
jgi:hypothetical protein